MQDHAESESNDALIVFEILIPLTHGQTGIVHPPRLFTEWFEEAAEKFRGITFIQASLYGVIGLWYRSDEDEAPIRDHSNYYKIAVGEGRVSELREYIRATATRFGQECIFFERGGTATFEGR